jgi:putative DNA primase/helicase
VLLAHGPEELRRLVTEAASGQLSFDGELTRLFDLDPAEYERQRVEAAKKHGVRRSFLDDARKAARAEAEAAEEAATDDPPYHEPVTDLAAVLDAALVEVRRCVVAPEQDLATVVVWGAHAHLVHHPTVQLLVSPKLATQSPDKQCGKTTLLEVIGALAPRPETGSSITAAAVFRLIEARSPTLLIDEADRVLRSSNEELIAVLNSGHRRSGAYVWRVEEVAKKRMVVKFRTWGAVAFAGIRELPETLQDRSIVIRLVRAKPGEVKAHLKNGTSPTLQLIKAKLARWALDLRQFPEPTLPPVYIIVWATTGRRSSPSPK